MGLRLAILFSNGHPLYLQFWDPREDNVKPGAWSKKKGAWCFIKKGNDHNWGYCGIRTCTKCDKGKEQSGTELGQA